MEEEEEEQGEGQLGERLAPQLTGAEGSMEVNPGVQRCGRHGLSCERLAWAYLQACTHGPFT